ncbi:sulfate transporter family-domain-containing protein [Desarmillaria tabescens]|uniref:Sulfate transporter family-domain-containing protein n=1 Tax=Armillaria tabescens TaxID=1929756 RepID=A0AA39K760_ARMTA|nr:sulfate transporter family-domain-containing protein [Desarmillaria tabescens]KAK0455622.1 sulfate transporter family-domain-containing protein [Desarmillaria tabescens]
MQQPWKRLPREEIVPVVSSKDYVLQYTKDSGKRRWITLSACSLYLNGSLDMLPDLEWLTGDLITSLTIGMVIVPQSMSHAQIATLDPEYGLYSSFVGVLIYSFFATSKDVSVGNVAVMSSTVSEIINIIAGQAWIDGYHRSDTHAATYKVIINTLKGLLNTKLDAAWGLTGLVVLYSIRMGSYPIKILKIVRHAGQPDIDPDLVSALTTKLPIAVIILLLEHVAIATFGRLNGYKTNPNQEPIAIGVTNIVGCCFGVYPATGSFSRSALKSKSGVRTPATGIITAIVVIGGIVWPDVCVLPDFHCWSFCYDTVFIRPLTTEEQTKLHQVELDLEVSPTWSCQQCSEFLERWSTHGTMSWHVQHVQGIDESVVERDMFVGPGFTHKRCHMALRALEFEKPP